MEPLLQQALQAYKKVGEQGVAPVLRYDFYTKAIYFYNQAHSHASSLDQSVSISRNLGMASLKAAQVIETKDVAKFHYHLCQSVHHLSIALHTGTNKLNRPLDWKNNMQQLIVDNLDLAVSATSSCPTPDRISTLLQFKSPLIPLPTLLSELHFRIATLLFNKAITLQDEEEWTKSKSILSSLSMYVEEGLRLCAGDGFLRMQIEDLDTRKYIHFCIAESAVMRAQADASLAYELQEREFLNIDQMWDITDMYKQATILTRENDVEGEATALSRMGRMYNKVFKIKERAHGYYRRSIELAMTLMPRDLSSCAWFKEAEKFLRKYQDEKARLAEEQENKWKQPYLDELKDVLAAITTANAGSTDILLKHLYETHPPKGENQTIPTDLLEKKKLLKAITHYHPDKQALHDADKKWFVLCEEITKVLNVRYQTFK